MDNKYELTGDNLLVEVIKEGQTSSGVFVVNEGQTKRGKVVNRGDGMVVDGGAEVTRNFIKIGDEVIFQYGTEVFLDGKNYVVLREADVLVIVRQPKSKEPEVDPLPF